MTMDIENVRLVTLGLLFGVALGLFVGVVGLPMWFNLGPYAL
jgi:hypothetical protein